MLPIKFESDNLKGEVTKKNPSYKKTASIKLIEDEWGIIDIP